VILQVVPFLEQEAQYWSVNALAPTKLIGAVGLMLNAQNREPTKRLDRCRNFKSGNTHSRLQDIPNP